MRVAALALIGLTAPNNTTFIALYGLFCDMWSANSSSNVRVYCGCPNP